MNSLQKFKLSFEATEDRSPGDELERRQRIGRKIKISDTKVPR